MKLVAIDPFKSSDVLAMLTTCLLVVGVLLCLLHMFIFYGEQGRMIRKVPGPRNDFIVGNGFTVMRSAVEIMKMLREHAKIWKGIHRIWIYPYAAVIVYNPEDIETVTSNTKHADKSIVYEILKPWLRDGLLISNGLKWHERRKILSPAFHFNILRQFCEVIVDNSQRLVESLALTQGQQIDIAPVLSEFTLSTICETAMGTPLNEEGTGAGQSYKEKIYKLGSIFFQRLTTFYLYSDLAYGLSSLKREQDRCLKIVHGFTEEVINKKRKHMEKNGVNYFIHDDEVHYMGNKKKKAAMLDILLSAEKEGFIDSIGVQEEVDTFMFEGHDTTASGLTFCLMLLANHKEIQDKIVAELKGIFGDSNRPMNVDDLPKMRFMECCIKESLRMYPPVHLISRLLKDNVVLSNYKLPPGSLCHISIYDLHHREDLFPNPEQFDPDRFLPENSVGRHPYAYIPFSAGPRNCIGQRFAMMEMKVAVAEVLRHFELAPVTRPEDIQFVADLVLRSAKPVLVNFIKRPRL